MGFLFFMQQFIWARVTLSFEKACLVQMHKKGKPGKSILHPII